MLSDKVRFFLPRELVAYEPNAGMFPTCISEETVEIDMNMNLQDEDNVRAVIKSIHNYQNANYEDPKQILMGIGMFLSVLKYVYLRSNGGLSFDFFMNIPITLVQNANADYLMTIGKDNKTNLLKMLRRH